jgi:hypothetical protein
MVSMVMLVDSLRAFRNSPVPANNSRLKKTPKLVLGLCEGHQATGEAYISLKRKTNTSKHNMTFLHFSFAAVVADRDPGSDAFLNPGSGSAISFFPDP